MSYIRDNKSTRQVGYLELTRATATPVQILKVWILIHMVQEIHVTEKL